MHPAIVIRARAGVSSNPVHVRLPGVASADYTPADLAPSPTLSTSDPAPGLRTASIRASHTTDRHDLP
jgi:hypothetical protein